MDQGDAGNPAGQEHTTQPGDGGRHVVDVPQ
jgi:hypothetical protein